MNKNSFWLTLTVVLGVFLVFFLFQRSQTQLRRVKEVNHLLPSTVNVNKDDSFLEELDDNTLKHLLYGLLTPEDKPCSDYRTFGNKHKDGGYEVCLEGKLAPAKPGCNVLSFGVSLDWTFDDEILTYGCNVHSYDPSIGLQDHKRAPTHWFHNLGLGKVVEVDQKRNWSMVNIVKALADLGLHEKMVDVIKVDAEGAEYPFLEDILANKINVKQMILEIHSFRVKPEVVTKQDLIYTIKLIMGLRRGGYILSHSYHKFGCCAVFADMFPKDIGEKCCHEVYFYNTKYL